MKWMHLLITTTAALTAIFLLRPAGAAEESSWQASDRRPTKPIHNVLLIIADDQGMDLGACGNGAVATPNLDRLAKSGTFFTNAFATVSSCSPSRSVLYSGLYSHTNGMYGLAHDVHNQHLLPWVETLPALLKKQGYSTCLIGKKHILPNSSLTFDQELVPEKPGKRDVKVLADAAEGYFREHKKIPFFMVVAFSDPHRAESGFAVDPIAKEIKNDASEKFVVPSHLPDLPEVRRDLREYYAAVERLDTGVGMLMDQLKIADLMSDTLIIYVSDNGRPFAGAKTTLYDEGIHLPLIVESPAQKKTDVRNDAMVSWIDIAPTILQWTEAAAPSYKLPGRSLLPILDEEHPIGWDSIFASHNFHEINQYYPMRALRTREFKYIRNLAHELKYPLSTDVANSASWHAISAQHANLGDRTLDAFFHRPAEELYEMKTDPNELRNLANDPKYKTELEKLRTKTDQFQKATDDPWLNDTTR